MTLTNRERRENMAFLYQDWVSRGSIRSYSSLPQYSDGFDCDSLFMEMAYQIFASQKGVAESVILQDWERMKPTLEKLLDNTFSIEAYALDPPVFRNVSSAKIIDLIRLQATRETWERLSPAPTDADIVVDVLHASTGGALKARAFQVVHNMRLDGRWTDEVLDRYSYMPTTNVRLRAGRMGLVDLPTNETRFADLKSWSRALCAIANLSGVPVHCGVDPILKSRTIRCERCDASYMACCPVPHCRYRRSNSNAHLSGTYTDL